MKVTLGRKFQVPGDGYESRSVEVELSHTDIGVSDEEVQENFKQVRSKLVHAAERILVMYLIANGRVKPEDAVVMVKNITTVFGGTANADS